MARAPLLQKCENGDSRRGRRSYKCGGTAGAKLQAVEGKPVGAAPPPRTVPPQQHTANANPAGAPCRSGAPAANPRPAFTAPAATRYAANSEHRSILANSARRASLAMAVS